jgi:predicted ATP-dependent protease
MLVMQCGMQYYSFAQSAIRKKIDLLHQHALTQQQELDRLEAIRTNQKHKRKQMLELNDRLDDKAIKFEIEINRNHPELLQKMLNKSAPPRTDMRFVETNPQQHARTILEEHGILKGNKTALLDQVTGTLPRPEHLDTVHDRAPQPS